MVDKLSGFPLQTAKFALWTFNPEPNESQGWPYQVGTMQPLWISSDVLLKQLVDILNSTVEDTEDSEGEDDIDIDKNDSSVSDTIKCQWHY